jgi:hypothetical protein
MASIVVKVLIADGDAACCWITSPVTCLMEGLSWWRLLSLSSSAAAATGSLPKPGWRNMFIQRYYDYDMRDYKRSYYFNFFGLIRVLKFKTNTVMEKEDWIVIVEIFGKEFILK